jgi:hypothetical protein
VTRAACLLIAAALALGSTGCGGNGGNGRLSKSQYESKLHSLSQDLSSSLATFSAFRPTDLSAAPGFLTKVADTLDRVARALKDVKPPKDVQALHARLREGAANAAEELRTLVYKLKGASATRMNQLLAEFDPARLAGLQELERAAAGLVAKGYRFGSA